MGAERVQRESRCQWRGLIRCPAPSARGSSLKNPASHNSKENAAPGQPEGNRWEGEGHFPSSDTVRTLGKWRPCQAIIPPVRDVTGRAGGEGGVTRATACLCDDRGQSPRKPLPQEEVPRITSNSGSRLRPPQPPALSSGSSSLASARCKRLAGAQRVQGACCQHRGRAEPQGAQVVYAYTPLPITHAAQPQQQQPWGRRRAQLNKTHTHWKPKGLQMALWGETRTCI